MQREKATIDGNEAAAHSAYHLNEVIAIYPITPSSNMGEWSDAWSAKGIKNIWGTVPVVTEMQSEGGASGAIHGALQAGALATTFTSSQGLLLMIPNMYKIAGELTSAVFQIAARSVAAHALSIFGDHSDVMACRQTGWAMLCSNSVQEAMDFACIAQAATLASRIPFLHFFDGFRTSHELMRIDKLSADEMTRMMDEDLIIAHRNRALSPDRPVLRGTAQNPDVFFQARETVNRFYDKAPELTQKAMDKFAEVTGRRYHTFEYVGHPQAERVVILMGSGAEAAHEAVDYMVQALNEKVGLVKVRLYRPFSTQCFLDAIPASAKSIAVLDRTKEPGAIGEPLYLDVVAAFGESAANGKLKTQGVPRIIGGRYGLSSKEFTPSMVKSVLDELKKKEPKNHFVVGIEDDVTHLSLSYDRNFSVESKDVFRGLFYGFGSDGTVTATKNNIKIISDELDNYAQAYFVYDSKKSGSMTESHVRFGAKPIHSTYLISKANFVACHKDTFLEKFDILGRAENKAVFLLNSPYSKDEVWGKLPAHVQKTIIEKELEFYTIDAYKVARENGLGVRINTIMQTCFFAISGIIPKERAIEKIKTSIQKTFGARGDEIVRKNIQSVDQALAHLYKVEYPKKVTTTAPQAPLVSDKAPEMVRNVLAKSLFGRGNELPVSAMPNDGTFPTATTQWEKRNISQDVPSWDPDICIQCGKCTMVCPHAVIRIKVCDQKHLAGAPAAFKSMPAKGKDWPENSVFALQVSPEDCTGCELCAEVCPAKSKTQVGHKSLTMVSVAPVLEQEKKNWEFFESLPYPDRKTVKTSLVKTSQVLQPLFEYSGACAGCGETPYLKLVSQLFGDRMVVANATGCSSIYGGNLPTTPWSKNAQGRGPAWSNSLFEDNAEFGLGMRVAINKKVQQAEEFVARLRDSIGSQLSDNILKAEQGDEAGIEAQRERVAELKKKLSSLNSKEAKMLLSLSDYLVKKSVWIVGGDGWAYDIGYGGLDHVLASGLNVNILVLDTEVYSNTGGQMSKATPLGAVAKFAANGKAMAKKDLGLLAISYGTVYVARVALGANDVHTLRAMLEAEHYNGPSIIVAYCPCIAHGYNLKHSLNQSKLAVDSGYWPLYRFNPTLAAAGENPFKLDSKGPKVPLKDYVYNETRYKMLTKMDAGRAERLLTLGQQEVFRMWANYKGLAEIKPVDPGDFQLQGGSTQAGEEDES